MRAVVCLLAAAAAAACTGAGAGSAAAPAPTELRITVWPQGQAAGGARSWTLRCTPAGGTLPRPGRACVRLLALERPFAPVPKDVACTEIYGGPQVAHVRGSLRGRPVRAAFKRTDGCEIARWQRVRFLFPVPVGEP